MALILQDEFLKKDWKMALVEAILRYSERKAKLLGNMDKGGFFHLKPSNIIPNLHHKTFNRNIDQLAKEGIIEVDKRGFPRKTKFRFLKKVGEVPDNILFQEER